MPDPGLTTYYFNQKANRLTSKHTSFLICKIGMKNLLYRIIVKVKSNKIICPVHLIYVSDPLYSNKVKCHSYAVYFVIPELGVSQNPSKTLLRHL